MKVTGATVHLVTPELDAGPIVVQAPVPVLDDDTVETLSARILVEEHRIYPRGDCDRAARRLARRGAAVRAGGRGIARRLAAGGSVVPPGAPAVASRCPSCPAASRTACR